MTMARFDRVALDDRPCTPAKDRIVDANPITTHHRRTGSRARVLMAVGSAALAFGVIRTAPGQTPAAILKPARPGDEPAGRLVVRGASPGTLPNFAALKTNPPSSPAKTNAPQWLNGPSPYPPPLTQKGSITLPALTPTSSSVVQPPQSKKSFVSRSWDDVKEFFGGPSPTTVAPYRAPTPVTRAQPVTRVAPQPTPVPPTNPGVYAGPPAYRWYGWGSTTPGANPYAPTGHSPRGSATWYAESGATPGAFPVPVMNPTRPNPSTTSPVYTGRNGVRGGDDLQARPASGRSFFSTDTPASAPARTFAPPPQFHPVPTTPYSPAGTTAPTANMPAPPVQMPYPVSDAGHQTPIAETSPIVVAAAMQPTPAASDAVPTIALAAAESAPALAPTASHLTWQTARNAPVNAHVIADSTQRIAPATDLQDDARNATPPWVTRGQVSPVGDAPSLEDAVRNMCYGRAIVTTVRHTGPSTLLVRFTAATEDDARAAAEAVSRLPQLRPYEVCFEVSLAPR